MNPVTPWLTAGQSEPALFCQAIVRWPGGGVWDETAFNDGMLVAEACWPIFRAARSGEPAAA